MRIALISDIHGNLVALQTVLADAERAGVDRFVCLGDVAAAGPQPGECVRRVAELACPVVMGNTDELLRNPPDPADAPDEATRLRFTTLRWGADRLTAADRASIDGYQPTVRVDLGGGAELLCYHGSPRSFDDVVLPTSPDEAIAPYFEGTDALLLAGGHTHVSMVRPIGTRLLINPGSVGMTYFRVAGPIVPRPAWAEYGIVTWEAGVASVELRRVPLDRDPLLAAARQSGMPNQTDWIAAWG
jgi:predicted phosphodiesterase